MPEIKPEGKFGVVEGLDYEHSRRIGDLLETEIEYQGTRIKFVPTRHALDVLVKELGRDAFASSCRLAWAHFYRTKGDPREIDFEWITQPYDHQREWWARVKDREFFAFEWEMGLGKSKTILDICQWAYHKGEIDALLVITLKDVHTKWAEVEVPKHFPPGEAETAAWKPGIVDNGMWVGPSARKRKSIVDVDKFAVAAINFDAIRTPSGLKFAQRFLRSRKAAIVVDESHHIKTPSAATTKAVLKLAPLAVRRWICTGTVSTGSPLDVWAQYHFLHPAILRNMKYWQFKARYAIEQQVGNKTFTTWEYDPATKRSRKVEKPVMTVVGFKNQEELKSLLDPFRSRLLKEDCLDLPDKVYRLRSFELSPDMRKAYQTMLTDFRAQVEQGVITANMAMTQLIRLQQITCNFVTLDDGNTVKLSDKNPRLEALLQELEKVDSAVIWAYWKYSLKEIADALRKIHGDAVVEYHGDVSDADKAANLRAFHEGRARFFVANPQSAGTGIDLIQTSNMFYYNNSYNLALRLQSEDRIHRIGQTSSCTITDIECLGTLDRKLLRALRDKRDVASFLSGDNLRQWLSDAV